MQLEYICNQIKNKNEIAIIKEYNYIARRHTIMLTSKKIFSDLCWHCSVTYRTEINNIAAIFQQCILQYNIAETLQRLRFAILLQCCNNILKIFPVRHKLT